MKIGNVIYSILTLILSCTFALQVSAQGWVYDFSNKTIASLEEEGFEFTNFVSGTTGVITGNLAQNNAQAKTPYWLLGEEEYITFSGARLNSAAGNGQITVVMSMVRLDGSVAASQTYSMNDASADVLPEFEFEILEKGFYRIVLDISYTGNKKNIELVLSSFESNLPEQTFTPEQAATAIEIYSEVETDKLEYYQTEPAIIHFKVYFKSVDEVRDIRRVRYQLVVPDGFKVSNASLALSLKTGGQGLRTNNTLEDEEIELALEGDDWILYVTDSNTDREVDIIMDASADGDPGGYTMESNLEEADPGYINEDPNAESPAIIIVPFGVQPVELIFFEGLLIDSNVNLRWATALEIENDYFTIERSGDGLHYKEIGRVKGKGNHSGRTDYNFTDKNVNGIQYYRLKQVDYDETFSYSEVIRIQHQRKIINQASLYPNPVRDQHLSVTMRDLAPFEEIQLAIIDMAGTVHQRLQSFTYTGQQVLSLDLNGLRNGQYFLQINTSEGRILKRFIVLTQ